MLITVVSDVLGEENNGTSIAAMNLIRSLKKKGHTVRILCADTDKEGVEGYYISPSLSLGKILNSYVKKVGVTIAKGDDKIVRQAINGVDHVHIMLPFGLGSRAATFAKEQGISTTAGFHMQAENLTSYVKLNKLKFVNKWVYKYIYRKLYSRVGGIHYPTEFIKNVFESNIKKQTNGYVISNGVNAYVQKRPTEKPDEFKDKIVILSCGRYAREKSQDTLIKAVKLSKYKDKIQLILAGQGLKEKKYRKLAKSLTNPPVFKFVSRSEIIDMINYCDLYVHSADIELEGIACTEAITCGKLTIVSDSKLSATRNFAIDQTCVFNKRNPKSLAKVIDYWIENPEKKKEYEQKYLESAVSFNQDECMDLMEKMIFEVHTLNNK